MQNFNINQPYINPGYNDSMPGTFKTVLPAYMKTLNTVMPAKIINYDRTNNRAQVQVMINTIGTGDDQVAGQQVASVPTLILGGGDFMISFPLNPGDLGWLIATDRDMSLFLQSYQESAPGVLIIRDFASSYFIPDIMTNYAINSEDNNNFVIQKKDSTVKISLSNNSIHIEAPNTITLTAPNVIIDGKLHADYIKPDSGSLYIEGDVEAEGNFTPDVPPP